MISVVQSSPPTHVAYFHPSRIFWLNWRRRRIKSVIQESLLLHSLEDFPYVSSSSVLFSQSHMTHNLESSETLIAQYKEQMPTFLFYCGSRASDYGLMKINEEGQVLFFKEKPKGAELQAMVQAWFLFTLLHFGDLSWTLRFIMTVLNCQLQCWGVWGQQVDTTVLGLSPEEAKKKPYIASMGIYVFKKDVLLKLLRYNTSF